MPNGAISATWSFPPPASPRCSTKRIHLQADRAASWKCARRWGAIILCGLACDYRRSEGELFEDSFSAFTGALGENRFAGGVNTDFGLFAEHDWQVGAVTLTGGLRSDRYRIADGFYRAVSDEGTVLRDDSFATRADWLTSWRGGALWQASNDLRLRAAAYRGFRLPTLNELYRPFVVFPVVTLANASLAPERLEGFEAGVDFAPAAGVDLSLTLFDNKVKGAIANVTLEQNRRERRNLDAIDARGIEAAANIQRGPFSVVMSAAFTDAKVRASGVAQELDGNRPAQAPRFSGSARATYRFGTSALAAITVRHVSRQFESDQESDILPAATTIGLYGELPLKRGLSAVGRVENLFDETIVTRNAGGARDLGAPRTLWLGLRYGF